MTINPNISDIHDQITFNNKILDSVTSSSSSANKTLSNLNSPTSINQDLIPNTNRNLGNATNRWLLYTTGITNSSISSPFFLDFERTTNYPFLRYRRSDLSTGFAFGTTGVGLNIFYCDSFLFAKQPTTEYSNIGLLIGNTNIFGGNNTDNINFLNPAKITFNSSSLSGHDSPAQVQLITKNNNNMDSYFLFQCSNTVAMRGGFLLTNTQANTSGNTSIKFSAASGNSDHCRMLIANVQNNSPDTVNCKILETFGSAGSYTFGRNIAIGDETNRGVIQLFVDRLNFNSNSGNGVLVWNSASSVPSGNPNSNILYEYVESGYKKIRYDSGFIVTL